MIGAASTGGDPAAIKALTRDDLLAFYRGWIRPEKAKIFVVSDRPLGEVQAALESRFGNWRGEGPAGTKAFDVAPASAQPQIVLVDRPGSPQSVIVAGEVLAAKGTDELLPLITANDPLGGSFLSRLNMDIRETKAWSYGVEAGFSRYVGRVPYYVSAPVQTDKTGASIQAMLGDMNAFLTTRPLTQEERDRTVQRSIRQLPGSFETGTQLINAMQRNDLLKRPDDYYTHIADKYRALTVDQLNAVARAEIKPADLVWVVVGDAAKIKPQLDKLGLPVDVASVPGK